MLLTAFSKVFPREKWKHSYHPVRTLIVTFILLLAAFLPAGAQDNSPKVTLSEKNVSLKKLLTDLSRLTGVSMMYDEALIQSAGTVSIHVKDVPLKEALESCLKNKALDFHMEDNIVVIQKRNQVVVLPAEVQTVSLDIKGKVMDEKGNPLEGATVYIKGTGNYLVMGSSGMFSMGGVPAKGVLVVSNVGYQTKEIPYNSNRTVFNVALEKKVAQLANVTVGVNNGYQVLPRERTTGSFDIIDSPLFNRSVSPNFLDHLDGVASGVNFDNRSAGSIASNLNKGRTQTFYIRGLGTVNSSNSPLVVVDGFPYNSQDPYKQDINNINPNDIESVTVLKDAAAASIWGARAGNGVVVITTKAGKYNQRPVVNFNTSVTLTAKPDLFSQRILSTPDYIGVEKSLFAQGNYSSLVDPTTAMGRPVSEVVDLLNQVSNGSLSQADADAQITTLSAIDLRREELKYFYRTGVDQQYNVTVRGGGATNRYFISAGYDKGNSVDYSFQKRFTLTATNTFKPVANLEISVPVSFADDRRGSDVGTSNYTGQLSPYTRLTDASGKSQNVIYGGGYNTSFIQTALNNGLYDVSYNPIEQFHAAQYDHKNGSLLTISPDIRYSLKGWSAEVKYQYSKTTANETTYQSDSVWSVKNLINDYTQIQSPGVLTYPINRGGTLNINNADQVNNNIRATIGFNHSLGADHRLDAIAGYERNEIRISGIRNGWYGYNPNTGIVQQTVDYVTYFPMTNNILANYPYNVTSTIAPMTSGITGQFVAFVSSFANAAYTYKDRYVFSGSVRLDQANLFGVNANNKKKSLWSGGVSWRIDKEPFYRISWLTLLKLRATYGYQGNIPGTNYLSQTTINYYPGTSNSSGLPYASLNSIPNPNLTWEKTGQTNIGLDFSTRGDVFGGTIEYYSKKGTDLIAAYPVDATIGVSSRSGNIADMIGKGVDLTLTAKNINTKNFKWTSRLLFSHNTDKLTRYFVTTTANQILSNQTYSSYPSYPTALTGNAVYGIYGMKWAGLDGAGNPQGYDSLGKVSTDYNQLTNYTRLKDLHYYGSALPTYFGSFMNDFTFKGFTVSVNITYKAGYYFHAHSINYNLLYGYGSTVLNASDGSSDYSKRWQKAGDEKHTNVPSAPTLANSNYLRDEFYKFSSALVQRGDNIRLKDVSLSYDFNSLCKASSPFSSVVLYGYYVGNTLLWKANKMGIDPDFTVMKPSKSYSLGLRLGFK